MASEAQTMIQILEWFFIASGVLFWVCVLILWTIGAKLSAEVLPPK